MSWKKWAGTITGAALAPLTGGMSLVGGYMYDTNKQQNKANQKAVDRANAYDMYTWDLANQYNNPVSQMQRLKAAGLNPNLVYGSGNVTGNTTGQAGSNGVASQEVFNGVTKGMQTAQAVANLQNTIANNKLLQFQQEKTAADRLYTEAQTTNLNNFLNGSGNSTYTYGIDTNLDYKNNNPSFVSDPVGYTVHNIAKAKRAGGYVSGNIKQYPLRDSTWNELMSRAGRQYQEIKSGRAVKGRYNKFYSYW